MSDTEEDDTSVVVRNDHKTKKIPSKSNDAAHITQNQQTLLTPASNSMSAKSKKEQAAAQKKSIEHLSQSPKERPHPVHPDWAKETKKLDTTKADALVERLYSSSIKLHDQRLEQQKNKIYKFEEPKLLSDLKIRENVLRLTDFEVEKRQKQVEKLTAKYYQTLPPQILTPEAVDENVKRLYDASTKHILDKQKQLDEKYVFQPAASKVLPKDVLAENVQRLSKAKSSDYSSHPFYGATHGS